KKWFEKENPYAIQEIAATLIESARKGYWNATDQDIQELAQTFIASVAEHGISAGLITGGNTKLYDYTRQISKAPGERLQPELLAQFEKQIQHAPGKPGKGTKLDQPDEKQKPEETKQVQGKEMEKVEKQPQALSSTWQALGVAIAVLLLVILGYRLRRFPKGKSRL
ncbi:MAG: cobaltochelatase subunit CobN, partial [Candidatus Poribacteria bacterium]